MKNILILIRSIGNGIGGVEVVSVVLANKFVLEGHRVSLFVFTKGNSDITNRLHPSVNLYVAGEYKNSKKNSDFLRKILIDKEVDVVINQWGLPRLPINVINRARKDLNVKVVSVYHNDPCTNGRIKNVEIAIKRCINPLKQILLQAQYRIFHYITSRSMRYVYNYSDRYLVLSPSYIDSFSNFTGVNMLSKLSVQTNPVTISSDDFYLDVTQKQKEIIYIGRIDYIQKRVERIVALWTMLEKKHPEWKLTIVGDGPERKNLENYTRNLQLENISFVGFKNPKDYYKRASLLIMTSEYEGFPLVLAEGMSFGVVPVVYGSFSSVYDIIETGVNGIIVPRDENNEFNSQMMADALSQIMDSRELYESMAINAISKSHEFNIDVIYEQWKQTFDSLT